MSTKILNSRSRRRTLCVCFRDNFVAQALGGPGVYLQLNLGSVVSEERLAVDPGTEQGGMGQRLWRRATSC